MCKGASADVECREELQVAPVAVDCRQWDDKSEASGTATTVESNTGSRSDTVESETAQLEHPTHCRPCVFLHTKGHCKMGLQCDFCHEPHDASTVERPKRIRRPGAVRRQIAELEAQNKRLQDLVTIFAPQAGETSKWRPESRPPSSLATSIGFMEAVITRVQMEQAMVGLVAAPEAAKTAVVDTDQAVDRALAHLGEILPKLHSEIGIRGFQPPEWPLYLEARTILQSTLETLSLCRNTPGSSARTLHNILEHLGQWCSAARLADEDSRVSNGAFSLSLCFSGASPSDGAGW
eukprot:CAMPEP_0204270536 /NCGR_PEP_ID=MMETSP0468-20130131/18951_1 /ASSEMBLY_ACC=CAM_ASM_000383 /TAXON_ID=2969 /ORGANISM="Oxyrrhis marina" /LENGTH=292 /DNA_ID=CAMNT_0051246087 /DNA_START=46 /DNA_END=921 /DNA_ORIENTATION=+